MIAPGGAAAEDASAPGFRTWLGSALVETLTVTAWLDSNQSQVSGPASVRFRGRRRGPGRTVARGDTFVHDEPIADLVPGGGWVSLTARVRNIEPGEWEVTAELLRQRPSGRAAHGWRPSLPLKAAGWSWRNWGPSKGMAKSWQTGLTQFCPAPAEIPLIWGAMVVVGILAALGVFGFLAAHQRIPVVPALVAALGSIVVGAAGGKVWYMWLHRRDPMLFEGWAIQGFAVGTLATLAVMAPLLQLPISSLLDLATPGLFMGLAIGRVGCFFAGCCAGRPSGSRWTIWSSDRRMGMRRLPTQLLESALCLAIAVASLTAVLVALRSSPFPGGLLLASLAVYTLGRQAILALRAEHRQTRLGSVAAASGAAVFLVADLALMVTKTRAGL